MTKWKSCSLGDVLTLQRGFDITKAAQNEGDFPVISSSGINSFHSEAKCDGPGVVIGRKGSLGTCYYIRGPYWPHDTTLWVKDFKGNDPKFCYALLRGMDLAKYDVGAANPTLNRNHIHLLPVCVPPAETQRRVASILTAYDDLIEVNERRIAILEEMARRLFEEWFVRFRFPGRDGSGLMEGLLGPAPAGWDIRKAASEMQYMGGGTPSKSEPAYWDEGSVSWFTPTDLTKAGQVFLDRSGLRITELGLSKSSARRFPAFSIMMTSRATLGVFAINTEPATTNQGFITFTPTSRLPLYFLYHLLRQELPRMVAVSSGATFKEITKGALGELDFLIPPPTLTQRFERIAEPMMQAVLVSSRQNTNLRTARDMLLPKLISGEITVGAAERALEDAA